MCGTVAIFKEENQLLIESGGLNLFDIDRIYIVIGGDNG